MENPTSSNPNITPAMIEAGRFKMSDIPGLMPSQAEIYQQAEAMARQMYPEKFGMISPEEFDRRNAEAHGLTAKEMAAIEAAEDLECVPVSDVMAAANWWQDGPVEPAGQSPMSRLFAAVRTCLAGRGIQGISPGRTCDFDLWRLDELEVAYKALNVD